MPYKKQNAERVLRRIKRTRTKIGKAVSRRPRVSVFISNKHLYAQIIDDEKGQTVAAAASREIKKKAQPLGIAKEVGRLLAERGLNAGIKKVVFDRGRHAYHGRVRELAEGAREGGLEF